MVGLQSTQGNNYDEQSEDEILLLENFYKYITEDQIISCQTDISISCNNWPTSTAYLFSRLAENIRLFLIVIFIDDFGLHQNMYRLLTGVYAMPARLSTLKKQKSSNAHTLMLGPHKLNFNSVLNYLQSSLGVIDHGSVLEING